MGPCRLWVSKKSENRILKISKKSENRIQKSRALVYWTEVFADTKYGLRWYYHARKTHFLRIDRSKFTKRAPIELQTDACTMLKYKMLYWAAKFSSKFSSK